MHTTNIVSSLSINARKSFDQDVLESQNYVSLCRALSAVEFRNKEGHMLSDDASKEEAQEKLKLACAEAVNLIKRSGTRSRYLLNHFM